ncbi:MAG: hypothetical protein AAB581_01940 [Patescibacteria group bacterium]
MWEIVLTTTLNGVPVRRETIVLYERQRTITAPKKGRAARRHKTKRPNRK